LSRHAARAGPEDRARNEHLVAAGLAAVVTSALAVAAHAGRAPLLVGVGLLQALLVVAWVVGTGLPGRIGGLLIGAGVAGAADAVLCVRDRASLAALLGVLALAIPAVLVHQLSRGVVRVRVTESMSGVIAISTAGASAASYLALSRAAEGGLLVSASVVAVGVGLVAGRLIDIVLPVPRFAQEVPHGLFGAGVSIALGSAAGAAYALGAQQIDIGEGTLLGAGTAGVAALVAVGVGYLVQNVRPRVARLGSLAVTYLRVGLPLALAGPVAYLVGLWAAG
jgi:hypothetical protein